MIVSLNEKPTLPGSLKDAPVSKLLDAIKAGRWRERVEKARADFLAAGGGEAGKKAITPHKKELPMICWSGRFSHRRNDKLTEHSGLVCPDLDLIEDMDAARDTLADDPHCFASYVSISGGGLKVLFKVDPLPADDREHKAAWAACAAHVEAMGFAAANDRGTKDVSRGHTVSFDPDLYVNADAAPIRWEIVGEKNESQSETPKISHRDKPSKERIRELLGYVPKRPEYHEWIKIVSAVGDALNDDDAIELLCEWSAEGEPGEYAEKLKHRLEKVSVGTLFHVAKQNGYIGPTETAGDDRKAAPGSSGKPAIVLPGGSVSITECAGQLYTALANSGAVFLRGKSAATLQRDSEAGFVLEVVKPSAARSLFESFVEPWAWRAGGDSGPVLKRAVIPLETAQALLDCHIAAEKLPPVAGLSNCAIIVERDGGLITAGKGYSQETGILIQRGDEPPSVPITEAVDAIRRLVRDYHFQSPGDESRALASFITPALKMGKLLKGYCPLDVAEADASQSGKTYRQRMVAAVYGEKAALVALKKGGVGSVDESLFAKLVAGRPFIQFDNFRGPMDSCALEAFLTAETCFACRLPHLREINVDPRRFIVMLSSNGVESTRDLANRSSIIRVFKREGVAFPETLETIRARQSYYLGCVFAIVREWYRAGKPRTNDTRHDFREWSQSLDWIVQNIFAAVPLMDGHVEAQERVSNPTLTFVRRIAIEVDRAGRLNEPLSASQIFEIADENEVAVPGLKPDAQADEERARKIIGTKFAALYRKAETITVDAFVVTRKEEHRDREGGSYIAKTYTFSRTTAQVAQGVIGPGKQYCFLKVSDPCASSAVVRVTEDSPISADGKEWAPL